MRSALHLVAVGVGVLVCALFAPALVGFLLCAPPLAAGFLWPDRPVAVGTATSAGIAVASAARYLIAGEIWLTRDWHGLYPLRFDWSWSALLVAADIAVEYLTVWGWAVFLGYMSAGIALRLRLRRIRLRAQT